jgi:UDP-N-acetylmuramoylalanine--D-glutamate ligase
MQLSGKTVVVVGLGDSGVAAAELCLRHGARVAGADAASRERLSAAALALEGKGARLLLGAHDAAAFSGADLVVVSPGVPPLEALERASARGIEVIGELELGFRFASAPVVAVGGTNGKSTTTSLVAAMLAASGKNVFAGGNLGIPLSRAAGERHDVLVVEVSSFQTERAPSFHPRVAALLNVTEDHLDRYRSFDAYVAAKGNMFVQQTPDDVAVVPRGDVRILREARRGEGRVVTFGDGAGADVARDGDVIVDRLRGLRYPLGKIRLRGAHNVANACAAIACAAEAGASEQAILAALESFEGLAHRTVLVAEIGGVRYYDDSKGTNVGAAVSALRGLSEHRVVLIAGGRDKLGDYGPLCGELRQKGRALVVLGEAADRIAGAAAGVVPIERVQSMEDAVRAAARLARPGDAVLLSPACSSFDMFRDYKHRGDVFAEAVRALPRPAGGEERAS